MSRPARSAIAYLAMFAGFGALVPYSPLYYQARGLDFGQIGWLLSIGALIGLLAAPAWGSLSDRFAGSPLVLLASATVAIAGVVALAAATSFPAVLAANVLMGVGLSGLSPIIDARALESAGSERAGYGPLRAWGSVGYVASSFLTGFAIQATSLSAMFVVMGVALAVTAIAGLGLRPAVMERAHAPLRSTLRLFRSRVLLLFLLGALLAWASMAAILDFLSLRFDELGAGTATIGLAAALAAAIEVPVMLGFPHLARRFGGDRLLIAGAAVLALRSGLTAVAMDPTVIVVATGLGGVGYALFLVGGVTYISDHVPPELAATGQGLFQGISISLSQVIAAAAAGMLAAAAGISGMFAVAAAVGVLAVGIVTLAVRPTRNRVALAASPEGLP